LKRIFILVMILCISMSYTASAFDITEIQPGAAFSDDLYRDIEGDVTYLRNLATSYRDRFVVTEEQSADIRSIDDFFANLSAPLTVDEFDQGVLNLTVENVFEPEFKKRMNLFKLFGGLSGYQAEFEPVAYFNIYRNITLVGGYIKYERSYENADDAYWQCVCGIESMTKETVPYGMRMKMLEKIRQLHTITLSDNRFKIFLLVDSKIDSIWERSDTI
jgi:hypothetical protein